MTELSPEEIFKPQTYDDTNKRSGTNADLEFLMVGVMWYDLLACVSTGSVPRLPYQSWLQTPHLDTADLMGCENWVMLAIGDLAYLSAWKGQQEKDGLLSIRELASKGIEIETRLENGIKSLDQEEVVSLPPSVSINFALACESCSLPFSHRAMQRWKGSEVGSLISSRSQLWFCCTR